MDREIDPGTRRRRRARQLLVAAGLVGGGGFSVFVGLPSWLAPSVARARVRIERVERGRVEAGIQASGIVVPAAEVVVSSPLETRVLAILKRPGDPVRSGEAIVALDTSAARLEAERLERRLERERNERSQLDLALEREIGTLDGAIETERLELEILRYRAEQQRRLQADGLVADGARREAEVAVRKGEITLGRLEQSRENAERTTAARRAALDLDVRTTEADLREARRQLELATTRAEREGVLTWVVADAGATVRQGDPVARIADLASFRVEARVSDVHAASVAVQAPARVEVPGAVLEGVIAEVEPAIEDGVARFTVALARPDHPALRASLRVDVWVVTAARDGVLRLRKGPFAQGGALQEVFRVEDDRAVRTGVRVGLAGREHLEIVDGLVEGDRVIVSDMRDRLHLQAVALR
jgi:HlyD family secretion protein